MERSLYVYEYVEASFKAITELLGEDPAFVLQPATAEAVHHAHEVVATLHAPLAGFDVGRDVRIEVGDFVPEGILHVRVPLRWRAADHAALFPSMEAELQIVALSLEPPRTQVLLTGSYRPPLGVLGTVADRLSGHRIAEAATHRFVREIATRIQRELTTRQRQEPLTPEAMTQERMTSPAYQG